MEYTLLFTLKKKGGGREHLYYCHIPIKMYLYINPQSENYTVKETGHTAACSKWQEVELTDFVAIS